jgi:ParB/RepB/Spo0J family partition protein
MPNTQSAVNNHEYRSVPVAALIESASNPRKRFDDKSLEELAATFKTQGILAPLLVRELEPSKYEVVAGARRLRAARIAELDSIPVRVVQLTDAEFSLLMRSAAPRLYVNDVPRSQFAVAANHRWSQLPCSRPPDN